MRKIYAKSAPEWTTLIVHLQHVAIAIKRFASYVGMDEHIAYNGAVLHDIGKAHPFFQERLQGKDNRDKVFRHEISSLFFLSAFPPDHRVALIEMVVAHHKSVKRDIGEKGLLDLDENSESYIAFHLGDWEEWSSDAIKILNQLGIVCNNISSNYRNIKNRKSGTNGQWIYKNTTVSGGNGKTSCNKCDQ